MHADAFIATESCGNLSSSDNATAGDMFVAFGKSSHCDFAGMVMPMLSYEASVV